MPVVTRSRVSIARGDGADALPSWGSASAAPAPAPPRRVLREDVASQSRRHHHHHGLKEKLRALTQDYEQQKQKQLLAASLGGGGPASRQLLRSSIRSLNAAELVNDENADEEEDGGRVAKRRYDAFALVPEAAVLRENAAPPQASNDNAVSSCPAKKAVRVPRLPLPPARKLSLGGAVGANPVSSPIQKAVRVPRLPVPPARKLSLGGAVGGGKLKAAAGEVGAGTAEAAESRILVFVRLRPMSRKEKEAGSRKCVKIVNMKEVLLMEFASENDYLRLKRVRDSHFCFDSVFPDSTTQAEVYSTSSADLVEGVLQGRNGTVFCYGATGAGKTYTMLGTMENPGVMVLAINDLFSKVTQKHSIKLSYLEIYNETVRDLLSPGIVNLREDKQQGAVAAGLSQRSVYSTEEVMELLQKGNKNRTTEPTRVNETSSRSHAVLQVIVEYRSFDGVNTGKRIGKLSLIDLAGSERALATDQRTLRSIEGANINKSLLALSSCINALVEGKKHIPYRNSKLTLLLKDSLGGSCNTVMIANISPSDLSFGETQNTLHWADRAKEIKTKIQTTVNEEILDQTDSETMLVLDLQKENSMLREQLAKQQQKLLIVEAQLLASKTSGQQSPAPSSHVSTPGSTQRKTRRSTLAGNYFNTLDSKRPTVDNVQVRELQRKVKTLESEIEKMKKEHLLQLKQKDEFIRGLINSKAPNNCEEATSDRRVVTRASLKKAQRDASAAGELKSPSHQFTSPVPTAKKRTFWDIGGNSPSVLSVNGRKTRSHVAPETPKKGSSKLLQPGFARQISSHRNI